jgi:hypothetical protein
MLADPRVTTVTLRMQSSKASPRPSIRGPRARWNPAPRAGFPKRSGDGIEPPSKGQLRPTGPRYQTDPTGAPSPGGLQNRCLCRCRVDRARQSHVLIRRRTVADDEGMPPSLRTTRDRHPDPTTGFRSPWRSARRARVARRERCSSVPSVSRGLSWTPASMRNEQRVGREQGVVSDLRHGAVRRPSARRARSDASG